MPLFRKRPVVIEAVRLTRTLEIHTLEGTMIGHEGDWLITGVKGEQYPCKPEIFEATYETADAPTAESVRIAHLEEQLERQFERWQAELDDQAEHCSEVLSERNTRIADLETELAKTRISLSLCGAVVDHFSKWRRVTTDQETWPPNTEELILAWDEYDQEPDVLPAWTCRELLPQWWLPISPLEQQP